MESFGFVPLCGQIQYWLLQIIEEPEAPQYVVESFGFGTLMMANPILITPNNRGTRGSSICNGIIWFCTLMQANPILIT